MLSFWASAFRMRYLMIVGDALRGWLDVCAGSAGGIERIVRSVARSRTEGETLHLTYTLLLLARARGMARRVPRRTSCRHARGSRGHTGATSAISRPSCGESTVSWLIAAENPKPPLLLCAVPSRSPDAQGASWLELRALHSFASRFPDQALREQLGDLIETIPSGHDLPAFRAATGLLNESG